MSSSAPKLCLCDVRQHILRAPRMPRSRRDAEKLGVELTPLDPREATREQVETFVAHLADRGEKDQNALLCELKRYLGSKEGAA
jgi:hypothetical protein